MPNPVPDFWPLLRARRQAFTVVAAVGQHDTRKAFISKLSMRFVGAELRLEKLQLRKRDAGIQVVEIEKAATRS